MNDATEQDKKADWVMPSAAHVLRCGTGVILAKDINSSPARDVPILHRAPATADLRHSSLQWPVAHRRKDLGWRISRFVRFVALLLLPILGCIGGVPDLDEMINPFRDLPAITMDGRFRPITANIVPLGAFEAGDVFELWVRSDAVEAVLILTEDEEFAEAGVMAGGGPVNQPFDYRVQIPGRYFAFIQFRAEVPDNQRTGEIALAAGDPAYHPPHQQPIVVEFEDGYLSNPGLYDPVSQTPDDQAFFASISATIADQVIDTLQRTFAETPIVIIDGRTTTAEAPFSTLRFVAERVLSENQDAQDVALPPPDPERPECQERVIFGEVLPLGTLQDVGNRRLDDEAIVYVGSFQGRGETCQTAIINSVNNIVLALANTAAHEIGHLIGLYHTEQITVMNRTATLAFFRELHFERSQIQVDKPFGDEFRAEVITTVIQDAGIYYQANFDPQ
jgi:hypothetical protein